MHACVCRTGALTVVALRVAQVHLVLDGPPRGRHALPKAADDLQHRQGAVADGGVGHRGRNMLGAGGGSVGWRVSPQRTLAAGCKLLCMQPPGRAVGGTPAASSTGHPPTHPPPGPGRTRARSARRSGRSRASRRCSRGSVTCRRAAPACAGGTTRSRGRTPTGSRLQAGGRAMPGGSMQGGGASASCEWLVPVHVHVRAQLATTGTPSPAPHSPAPHSPAPPRPGSTHSRGLQRWCP